MGIELLLRRRPKPSSATAGASPIPTAPAISPSSGDSVGDDVAEGAAARVLRERGEAWQRFESVLTSRGYYRGELPGSSFLYERLQRDAAAAYGAVSSRPHMAAGTDCMPPATRWLYGQAAIARSLLTTASGAAKLEAARLPSPLPAEESDAWLDLHEDGLDASMEQRGAPSPSRNLFPLLCLGANAKWRDFRRQQEQRCGGGGGDFGAGGGIRQGVCEW